MAWSRLGLRLRMLILLSIALMPLGVVTVAQSLGAERLAQQGTSARVLLDYLRASGPAAQYVSRGVAAAEAAAQAAAGGNICDLDPAMLARQLGVTSLGIRGQPACGAGWADDGQFAAPLGDGTGRAVLASLPPLPAAALRLDLPAGLAPLAVIGPADRLLAGTLPEALPVDDALFRPGMSPHVERLDARRVAGIVPLRRDYVAVAVWDDPASGLLPATALLTALPPLLMWGLSLLVVLLMIERLVLRNTRHLSAAMRHFARTRKLPDDTVVADRGLELSQVEQEFRALALATLQDQATLEDLLREKNMLLKEVHHRVKNNLQLIASILNMAIRRSDAGSDVTSLRRVLVRVLALAAAHRSLYDVEGAQRVQAAAMIGSVASQAMASDGRKLSLSLALEEVDMVPDQAIPLAMLTSEIVAEATRRVDGPDGSIRIGLRRTDGPSIEVSLIATPMAAGACESEGNGDGDRLARQLIRAFEMQLGGRLDVTVADGVGRWAIDVPLTAHDLPRRDF